MSRENRLPDDLKAMNWKQRRKWKDKRIATHFEHYYLRSVPASFEPKEVKKLPKITINRIVETSTKQGKELKLHV